ncbi:MAG: dihydropteroate synthase [Acidobacteria bacterium]|nr:dihydropteroate synthase [Acidobacteriota bacterium]
MKLIHSTLDLERRVQVMGVLNLTPDSFSDGGEYNDVERAFDRAFELEAEGADLIDIGGESTRPGSKPVSVAEELGRVLPLIERLQGRLSIPVSIDTTKSEVARAAIACGAEMINDISGLRFDPALAEIAAESGAGIVLMHLRGTPETMQKIPPIPEVFADVYDGLRRSIEVAEQRGMKREKIIIDPGIGFGKTLEQNLQLINGIDRIAAEFDLPVLLGASRKSFIKLALDPIKNYTPGDEKRQRMAGTAASVAIGVMRGARLVRVHDVREMVVVVRITERLASASVY